MIYEAPVERFWRHAIPRYKKTAMFAFRSERLRANGAPLRDCGSLHEGETEVDECCIFYPPNKIGNGRHQHTVMSTRDIKCKKLEQYHYMAPNAYQAAFVADHHDAEQVALARVAVADIYAGSQLVTHAMDMMGVRSVPLDDRTEVDTGWGKVHNEHLELNQGFAGDPGTSAYEQLRDVYHSKGIVLGRVAALFFSLDCKPNCMESRKTNKYRDEHHAPLPGADGDLVRSGDEQLLGAFLLIKRILDEQTVLLRSREGRRAAEEDAHESAEQADGEPGDGVAASSPHHLHDDGVPAPQVANSGGADCDEQSDQQGDVLPLGHTPDQTCLTDGCSRRRRRVWLPVRGRNCWRVSLRCFRECAGGGHHPTYRDVSQPDQGFYGVVGTFEDHMMSPTKQRLIAPPQLPQANLVPRLRQDEPISEIFFVDGTFVDGGDDCDDEPSPGQNARSDLPTHVPPPDSPTDTEPPVDAPLNRGRPRKALRDIPREHPTNPPGPRLANAAADEGASADGAGRPGDDATGQQHDAAEMLSVSARRSDQREEPTLRATGWRTGDMEQQDESRAAQRAVTVGQMPHGRWQTYVEAGGPAGIAHRGAEPWTAQLVQRDNGLHLGVATFRPTATVFDGTSEELAQRIVSMVGTRAQCLQTDRGVVSHQVRSDRRPDLRAMLATVGFHITNTNPSAASPMQSFSTEDDVIATAPYHRDERDALLVQLRGTKELLMHPPAPSIPGCPADIYDGVTELRESCWLWDFDPF